MKALAEHDRRAIDEVEVFGRVVGVQGLLIEVVGPVRELRSARGSMIETSARRACRAKSSASRDGHALLPAVRAARRRAARLPGGVQDARRRGAAVATAGSAG